MQYDHLLADFIYNLRSLHLRRSIDGEAIETIRFSPPRRYFEGRSAVVNVLNAAHIIA